jgi:hypothetical protein
MAAISSGLSESALTMTSDLTPPVILTPTKPYCFWKTVRPAQSPSFMPLTSMLVVAELRRAEGALGEGVRASGSVATTRLVTRLRWPGRLVSDQSLGLGL